MRVMRTKEERMKEIRVMCFSCKQEKVVTLTDEQYTRYLGWKTEVIPHIQDAYRIYQQAQESYYLVECVRSAGIVWWQKMRRIQRMKVKKSKDKITYSYKGSLQEEL
jgi:hypothetical protein